ncbi:MAG: LacI family DNA-binding transcriptional regulator [Anaerolineales bacterium]|nr:MAG: LacI family DNA-binding transcriptional regulator [Anaerolineales bacterium]
MAVTLKDIAQAVGKSVSTVSSALNDYEDVSQETKELVRRVAREMGYMPNIAAQRLRRKRTDTLGWILPTFGPRFSDPFFSELLAGIGNESALNGFDLLVSTHAPGPDEDEAYRRMVSGRRVDGLLVVRTRSNDLRIAFLAEQGFPFVAFGRTQQDFDFPYVDEDGVSGMNLVIQHLIDLGHRRIAFIAAPPDLMFATYRLAGFRGTMERNGLPLDESLIVLGDLTQHTGHQAAGELLDRPDRPTAIAACNDLMALGAMAAAQERGLIVGQDVAITGFDDIPLAQHSHPALTTLHQPIYRIGRMICDMLIKCIRGESLPERHVLLQPSLVVRRSSGG